MICKTCADAAGRRAPANEHCTDPTCPCGHRTDRYRTAPAITVDDRSRRPVLLSAPLLADADPPINLGRLLAGYEEHATDANAHAAAVEAAGRRLEGESGPEVIQLPRAGQRVTALPPMIRLLAPGEDPDAERPVITAAMLRATPHTDAVEGE